MKLIVFSDSHRELSHMREVLRRERPDYVFHLGDHDSDAEDLEREFPLLPIVCVRGNCDAFSGSPLTRIVTLGGLRFFLCHGHTLGVKAGLLRATYAAREQRADVLLFGHTHEPLFEQTEGEKGKSLYLLNPGSCGFNRPTYGRFLLEPGKPPEIGLFRA